MQAHFLLFFNFVVATAQPDFEAPPSPKCEDDIYDLRKLYHHECMEYGGIERCWFIPPVNALAGNTKVPLVVELHGYTACAEWSSYTGFLNVSYDEDFILVWPQGTYNLSGATDKTSSWHASDDWCYGGAGELDIDDVGFITKLIEKLSAELPVDTSRVYMAGHSNGCAMAQMMAAKRSSIIAGVACHALYLVASPSSDYVPTSVMEIHGRIDPVVGYDGWHHCKNTSAEINLEDWKNLNNCKEKVITNSEFYETITYKDCDQETQVALITLPNVGHNPYMMPGNDTSPVDTSILAWEFLKQFRKEQKSIDESSSEVVSSTEAPTPTPSSGKPNANINFPGLMMIICLAINQLKTK